MSLTDKKMVDDKKTVKEVNHKSIISVFISFSFVCVAAIFVFTVYNIFCIADFLSFDHPLKLLLTFGYSSVTVIVFGIVLSLVLPKQYIDNSNVTYLTYSLPFLFIFYFFGALFEELFFRGIVQNLLDLYVDSGLAIIATTVFFVGIHVQYYKKPVMLLNITIPSLLFGWVYFQTSNILVAIALHFMMNFVITLLLKWKIIQIK